MLKVPQPQQRANAQTVLEHVGPANYRIYLVINAAAIFGAVVHLVCIPFFWAIQLWPLAGFNMWSTATWAAGFYINRGHNHSLAITLLATDIVLYSTVTTLVVGADAGFHNYLLCIMPFAVFHHRLKGKVIVLGTLGLWGLYSFLAVIGGNTHSAQISPMLAQVLFNINIGIVLVALGIVSYFFREGTTLTERRVEALANTDALTQLPNRRWLWRTLEVEVERHRIGTDTFSLVLADIDHFKRFNDTYGHDCGDVVLRHVANIMRREIRRGDIVGRWGGEEFLFILAQTSLDEAAVVIERVRQAIANEPCVYRKSPYFVTASFGISQYETSLDASLQMTDDALYQAKSNGRNQIVILPAPAIEPCTETS